MYISSLVQGQLPEAQPIKPKSLTKNLGIYSRGFPVAHIPYTTGKSKEKERPLNNVGKRAKPLSTLPSPDRIETPKAKVGHRTIHVCTHAFHAHNIHIPLQRSTVCSACGKEKVLREFFIDCPSGITVGHTGIEKGNRAMLTGQL